jgi:hypothetical protein
LAITEKLQVVDSGSLSDRNGSSFDHFPAGSSPTNDHPMIDFGPVGFFDRCN